MYAGMRGTTETLGFVHMMREFKTDDWGRIVHRVDVSACRAIMLRRGCGGLKHITVKSLWVQEAVREYSIEIERISPDETQRRRNAFSPDRIESLPKCGVRGGRSLMLGRCSWIGVGLFWRWQCLDGFEIRVR